jgi:peptidoglycan hydrolase-like protein with peptidoglycan-binding domain
MNKFSIAACAFALAGAWTIMPAIAADETVKGKGESTMDKVKDKAVEAKDKVKEKAVEAKDKIKEKTGQAKDKVQDKKESVEAKAESSDVRTAQQALRDKGFDPGPIDGIHGPRTSAAVRNYQKAEGLTATGQLDDQTKERLNVRASATGTDKAPSASPPTGDKAPVQKRQSP